LLNLASGAEQLLFTPRYLGFLQNSLTLAGIAALVLTVGAAIALGFNVRLRPDARRANAMRIAGIGYAVPGGVIAIGILFPSPPSTTRSMRSWRRISASTRAF
jgi:iron(III) transport system permease protein